MTMTTQEQIDANLEQFEQMIRDLLELGYSATTAVKIAYKHFPIMELLEESLTADMVQNFDRGYHSVLIPNNGMSKKPTFSTKSISEAMRAAWTSDGLNLSQRLHGRSKKVKKEVGETIAKAIKEGKNTVQTARAIFSGYGADGKIKPAELPKYIQKVRKLRAPDYIDEKATQEYKKVLRSTERKIQQNTTPALRAAYSELVTATEKGSAAAVSKAVTVAVQEKARYNAERIARTENARAYADGQMLRYLDDEDVVALKWRLGSRHPRFDICDFYANADLYGLGKGVYPKDKFPRLPAHPHCMCLISPIYDFEIDISKAKDNVEEGGKAYISSLTKREQENLLGIHGRTMVIGGKESWTQRARGWSGEKFDVRDPKLVTKRLHNAAIDTMIKERKHNFNFNLQIFAALHLDKSKIVDKTDSRFKIPATYIPNSIVEYLSKGLNGKKQINFSFYDELGILFLQLHGGPHSMPKKHNVGTKENPEYYHKHWYKIVGYKDDGGVIVSEGDMEPLTEEERRFFDE